MFKKITRLFSGDPHQKKIEGMIALVDQINALETQYESLSLDELHGKTESFRRRLNKGEKLDDLLPEAFATVRESSKRVLGQRHYDVQLICGINLHRGSISEMRTGEGKTLAATLPLYLNALTGKGVHLVTVNDYLARRDGRWMGAIFHMLGMSVGILQMSNSADGNQVAYVYDPDESSLKEELNHLRPVFRANAYKADITYGTNSEFGFDYLRDNITMTWEQRVQRGHYYAIIDEVDNILIDESRTPLIISGPSHEDSENYVRMAQVVRALVPEDYEVSEKDHTVTLTELGIAHVEELLGSALRDPERPEDITPEQARLLGFLEQSLRAHLLYHRNKEYIVQNGQVIIVDEFTGRLMPGRRWSDGLHQSVEAKEGVNVQAENITHATVTIQNYFRMYEKLAGMTGTALTEEEEFFRIYGLNVLAIPTNLEYLAMKPGTDLEAVEAKDPDGYRYTYYARPDDENKKAIFFKRKDYPDIVYRSQEGKLRAIVQEIIYFHVLGRPQLVGTTSVESSEHLSERLTPESIRRLIQTLLIRKAWMRHNNISDAEIKNAPELSQIYEPLDKLRMPELRKLGSQFGLESLDPSDITNQSAMLQTFGLTSEYLPRLLPLLESGIPHKVLNARKHTEESLIIASAGAFGAVTIATNMAGRGVDIKLGGELSEEILARVNHYLTLNGQKDPYNLTMQQRLELVKSVPADDSGEYSDDIEAFIRYMDEMAKVRELGGLHVIGSERHEARRIDNQLRGRAARQGDPGSSRFYLALDDELMRLFGGAQVESMLSRFNIDENIPIESGLVGRLVEQSQTRVEGSNFDMRKHLLEYDDVLNEQRRRIYTQRDRIFTKEDLREDVTEMLRTELTSRIKAALADEEGAWKLLAYLEDVQPPINYDWATHPSYTFKMVMDYIGKTQNENDLLDKLLSLAELTIQAENDHIISNVQSLIARSQSSLETQLDERYEIVDTYLDTISEGEPTPQRDISTEISSMVHIPIRLGPADAKKLLEEPGVFRQPLKDAIKSALTLITVKRLMLTFEKRLNESWTLKANELSTKPWEEISSVLINQVNESLSRKSERLLGENGEIAKDLNANLDHVINAVNDQGEMMRLLLLMTQGTVLTFDTKSHQRVTKPVNRMNYMFLAANWLQGKNNQEITQSVLTHLEKAQSVFTKVFGYSEWEHLVKNNLALSALPETTKSGLNQLLGESDYLAIQDLPVEDVDPETKEKVIPYLGEQTQNRIYRRLLLSTITEAWVEYLTRMEALRVSISMESYAQRDPLVQYKSQASSMFTELLSEVRAGVISRMFRYRPTQSKETQPLRSVPSAISDGDGNQNKTAKSQVKQKKRKRH